MLLVAGLVSHANRYHSQNYQRPAYGQADPAPGSSVPKPISKPPPAEYRSKEAREEADVIAQLRMAAAAEKTLYVGLLSTGLLAATVVFAGLAWNAAADGAKAAWKSEGTARDIGQKQSMAYVHAIRAYIPKNVHSQNVLVKNTASVVVQFENIGKTIARKVDVSVALFEENFKMWSEYREVEYGKPFGISNIAPSQQPEITVINDLPSIIKEKGWDSDEKSDVIFLTLRGEVRYEDVFDNKFRTTFVFVVMTARSLNSGLEKDTSCLHFATDIPAFELIESPQKKNNTN